jgi:hypothetical protein
VVTWDPRGFGGSGGSAMFDAPGYEGRDVQALVDYVATQPDALLDAPSDPRVGMSGSSYGGAIQWVAAGIEPRIDAIVPDISWHSLVTSFARDGAFKAGWLLQVCADGELLGLTGGLTSPAGVELGSTSPELKAMCLQGNLTGALSPASTQWLADRGPGELLDAIRAPTLITQGTPDTLFPPGQAIANYDVLRAHDVPVKMLWYCGGHGTCQTPAGDPAVLQRAGLRWLQRWLKRDESVDTGPRFEWIDDTGVWRSGADYPLARDGYLGASGSGSLGLVPSVSVTLGSVVLGTPAVSMFEVRYAPPPAEVDIVGGPWVSLTYRGNALPTKTFVYAQVVDAANGRVVGGQVTPIPVVLDGVQHTITQRLEVIAIRGRPSSDLRLQLLPSAPLYGGAALGRFAQLAERLQLAADRRCDPLGPLARRRRRRRCSGGFARLARQRRRRRAEVRPAADRPIEARPALAAGQLLLQAIEGAEPAAEVVAEVHERGLAGAGHDRAAVLERAVVAEDDVQHGLGSARVEVLDRVDERSHAVVAERDLAVQLAGVGQLDRAAREGVGVELADVVQQRAGDRDVAVDLRERRADRAHRLGDRQRVLEQPVAVGLVKALGGRRRAVARPQRRVGAEHRVQQAGQVAVADGGEQLAQVGLHLRGRARRAVDEVGGVVRARLGGADRVQLELGAAGQPAADVDRRADGGDLRDRGDVVADGRRQAAGAVGQHEVQDLAAVAPGAQLGLADEQHALHRRSLLQLSDEHANTVARAADGPGVCGR